MLKKFSMISAVLFTFLLIPVSAFAAGGAGGEETAAASADGGLTYWLLVILSVATLIYMTYLCARDNG
ncbi:hypothetical protein [Alkalihalobacterium bogoriense]|uniref:hypothetical protein n=1 Tax=Alkalihalobacterium bogoriense TaxID=246272 RepID=UPI00047EF4B5|nr:hypothetical protein [Alkalihalobacterium bogoriense]